MTNLWPSSIRTMCELLANPDRIRVQYRPDADVEEMTSWLEERDLVTELHFTIFTDHRRQAVFDPRFETTAIMFRLAWG